MCDCISYNGQSPGQAGTQEVVLDQSRYFPDTAKPDVCVDACIAETIQALWAAGVKTRHSCCGHNGQYGIASVGLDDHRMVAKAGEILERDKRPWRIFADVDGLK